VPGLCPNCARGDWLPRARSAASLRSARAARNQPGIKAGLREDQMTQNGRDERQHDGTDEGGAEALDCETLYESRHHA
jgi:hypothetical protein